MNVKHLKSNKIKVDEKQALRFLKYKGDFVDEETSKSLKESIAELKDIAEPKYVYSTFDIKTENKTISFEDQLVVQSTYLSKLYENCDKSTILAATIGFEVEKRILYYSKTNLSKAIVFDGCAGSYIESLCDYIENQIKEAAVKEGYGITYRYSPGYGDLPLSHQPHILKLLNTEKHIGLTASQSHILLPRKSVTAFIGWTK